MTATAPLPNFFRKHRIAVIMGAVLMFHALAIWALQSGLLMRAVELVVPVEVLAQIIEPPKPVVPTPPPPPPPVISKEPPPKQEIVKPTAAPPQPAPPTPQTQAPPQILAVETAKPAPNAPAPVPTAPPAPLLPPSVPIAAVASPAPTLEPAVPSQVKTATPPCQVDYISQPKPTYPRMSINLGEQGTVEVRVLFTPAGLPINAELVKSSGFDRLDKAALDGTKRWRFVTCKNVLAAIDHWEPSPVRFSLD